MSGSTRRLELFVAVMGLNVAFVTAVWAQTGQLGAQLYQKDTNFGKFGRGSMELYWASEAKPEPIVRPVEQPGEIRSLLSAWAASIAKNDPGMSLVGMSRDDMLRGLKGISFLLDIQVQSEKSDVTDFSPKDNINGTPLHLKLAFGNRGVPDQLYLVGGNAPEIFVAVVQTRESYRISNGYFDILLVRNPGQPNIVWLDIYRWPPGDPHTAG